jgi:hypothetical protein
VCILENTLPLRWGVGGIPADVIGKGGGVEKLGQVKRGKKVGKRRKDVRKKRKFKLKE